MQGTRARHWQTFLEKPQEMYAAGCECGANSEYAGSESAALADIFVKTAENVCRGMRMRRKERVCRERECGIGRHFWRNRRKCMPRECKGGSGMELVVAGIMVPGGGDCAERGVVAVRPATAAKRGRRA